MSAQFNGTRDLVKHVQETEAKFLLHGDRHDPLTTPWMPYQAADFIAIVWECVPELKGDLFLDVGAGPGTKVSIASGLFGFRAFGVEIDQEMVSAARNPLVEQGDALDYPAYDSFDLIWLYRPFRDAVLERKLEQKIIAEMKPGAILAGGSWETDPASLGWQVIVDDTLNNPVGPGCIWRGAWQKLVAS